jgi:hypothetical protein
MVVSIPISTGQSALSALDLESKIVSYVLDFSQLYCSIYSHVINFSMTSNFPACNSCDTALNAVIEYGLFTSLHQSPAF